MKYYDIQSRLKKNPHNLQYFVCVSGRGTGKSHSMAQFLNWNYLYNKKKFLRLVRNNRFMPDCASYFDSFPRYKIDFDGRYYYKGDEPIGRALAITDYKIIRSSNFDDYNIIFMEEFSCINPDEYLVNEIDMFTNIISTVVRTRNDCMVVLIGNNNNRLTNYNPYFEWLGIEWDKLNLKQGDFRVIQPILNGARIGIERPAMAYESIEEIPLILRIAKNELATSGEFEEDEKVIKNLTPIRKKLAYSWQFKLHDKFYITVYNYSEKGFIYVKGRKNELSRVHCSDLTIKNNERQIQRFLTFIDKIRSVMNDKNLVLRYSNEQTHYQFIISQKNYLLSEKTLG